MFHDGGRERPCGFTTSWIDQLGQIGNASLGDRRHGGGQIRDRRNVYLLQTPGGPLLRDAGGLGWSGMLSRSKVIGSASPRPIRREPQSYEELLVPGVTWRGKTSQVLTRWPNPIQIHSG